MSQPPRAARHEAECDLLKEEAKASSSKLLLVFFKQPLKARGEASEALNLARDDDLRRLTVGGLFERLERLDLDDMLVGVGLIELLDGVGTRLQHDQYEKH